MAWPAMAAMLVMSANDLIDIGIVGDLGREAVAAYGYSRQFVHLVEMLVQSVGIACVALMSRAIGAGHPDLVRRAFGGAMLLSVCFAIFGAVVVALAPAMLLGLLDARGDVVELAVPYFRLVTASMVLLAVAFTFDAGLRAYKRTRAPLVAALVMLMVKPTVSYALVHGVAGAPALGLLGAAWGSVAAHAAAVGVYVVTAHQARREGLELGFGLRDLAQGWGTVVEVARVAMPAVGERLIMSLALMTYFRILSSYGTAAVAAYSIGVRLLAASWVPGFGFSVAASTFVGQALGARDAEAARSVARRCVVLAISMMSALGVVCIALRGQMARAFTDDPLILDGLLPFLLMLGLAQPFMGAHFTLGGVLRGAGDTVTPLLGAALGNWVFRVPLALLFARVLGLELVWVWAALIADHVSRMAWNLVVFQRGAWARRLGASAREEPDIPSGPEHALSKA